MKESLNSGQKVILLHTLSEGRINLSKDMNLSNTLFTYEVDRIINEENSNMKYIALKGDSILYSRWSVLTMNEAEKILSILYEKEDE